MSTLHCCFAEYLSPCTPERRVAGWGSAWQYEECASPSTKAEVDAKLFGFEVFAKAEWGPSPLTIWPWTSME